MPPPTEKAAPVNHQNAVVLATSSYDHTIRFWDPVKGACIRTIQQSSHINALATTPNKRFLAAAGNPHIRLFEVHSENNNPFLTFDGHTANVTSVGFTLDGSKLYTGSEDGTVRIWDSRAPVCQICFEHKAGGVNSVAMHPNQNEIISCSQGGVIKIWDIAAKKCSYQLIPDDNDTPLRSVSVSSNGTLLTAANNKGDVYVWRMRKTKECEDVQAMRHFNAHKTYVLKSLISPDSKQLATTSADHTVRLWSTDTFQLLKTLQGHTRWVWDCSYSADSAYLVTVSSDNYARLWDVDKGTTIRLYAGHTKAVVCVALNDMRLG